MRRGVSCVVLEKQARVGGRTESRINGLGETVDTDTAEEATTVR